MCQPWCFPMMLEMEMLLFLIGSNVKSFGRVIMCRTLGPWQEMSRVVMFLEIRLQCKGDRSGRVWLLDLQLCSAALCRQCGK